MESTLTVTLNGTERVFTGLGNPPTVAALVNQLGFREDRVALERNGDIVPRADWTSTHLHDGDRLELVHFVGGGLV